MQLQACEGCCHDDCQPADPGRHFDAVLPVAATKAVLSAALQVAPAAQGDGWTEVKAKTRAGSSSGSRYVTPPTARPQAVSVQVGLPSSTLAYLLAIPKRPSFSTC